ncbi:hypothetical protein [Oceaniglobus roseus]|uniref:hypothetical protein n=1 Tax=Oceaniglobus roseus TaxID=1737570 RepID=UPI000C7EA4CB|nr:hypothetical protein [Kandeliimicrobium roseum]
MTPKEQAQEIADLIGARLGVGGTGLETKLRRAGRLLPRRIRREAEQLAQAARLAEHPRLAKQLHLMDHDRAYRDCKRFLEGIDGSERIVRALLGFVTTNAFNVLVIGALLIALLLWRGFL